MLNVSFHHAKFERSHPKQPPRKKSTCSKVLPNSENAWPNISFECLCESKLIKLLLQPNIPCCSDTEATVHTYVLLLIHVLHLPFHGPQVFHKEVKAATKQRRIMSSINRNTLTAVFWSNNGLICWNRCLKFSWKMPFLHIWYFVMKCLESVASVTRANFYWFFIEPREPRWLECSWAAQRWHLFFLVD